MTTLAIMMLVSCSDDNTVLDQVVTPEQETTTSVAIMASSGSITRTTIDQTDLQTTRWSTDDKIALWAMASGAEQFSLEAKTFSMFYYGSDYNSAVFTADVDEMSQGEYAYYAVYPIPTSAQGDIASFSVTSTQNGYYDGTNDIMHAKVASAGALSTSVIENGTFAFSHLMHAIRIEVPYERDLLGSTSKLQITFPQDVVGDVSFDVTAQDPELTLTNASNIVFVDFDQAISQAGYVWVFIAPTIMDGEIEFIGYDANYSPSEAITTTLSDFEMAAGEITPMTITIPEEQPKKFVISIDENNLGEDITSINLKAPTGACFESGISTATLTPNSDGDFEFSYISSLYDSAFKAGEITLSYESKSAIVSGESIVLTSEHNAPTNYLTRDVPYLFEEDFSGVSGTGYYNGLSVFSKQPIPGLSYWPDGRIYSYWEGNCVAVKAYYLAGTFNGHLELNLSGMTGLRSDATVTLNIILDADWEKDNFNYMNLAISNDASQKWSITMTGDTSPSSSNIPTTHDDIMLSGCTSESVITFATDASSKVNSASHEFVYMDNIKIKIAQ